MKTRTKLLVAGLLMVSMSANAVFIFEGGWIVNFIQPMCQITVVWNKSAPHRVQFFWVMPGWGTQQPLEYCESEIGEALRSSAQEYDYEVAPPPDSGG